ncbi:MAG: hypothetical protein AB7E30_05045 [Lawsonibacter sp.]
MFKKALTLLLTAGMALSLAACGQSGASSTTASSSSAASSSAAASSGSETVKIICPYGAGGTADAIARKYAKVAGELYPQYNFIVENQTGGDGFAAATSYTEGDVNTTDLLIYGYGVAYRHDIGKNYDTEIVDFDRSKIYPIASVDDRTWILYAQPGTTLASVIEKAQTGGVKMSGGNPLSDPHLALGSLLAQMGGKVTVVPYDGGAAQKKGLTDQEVDVFVGTTQAGKEEVEAGTLVPILAFSDTPFTGFVGPNGPIDVPTIAGETKDPALDASIDFTGSILPAGGFVATRVGADQAWIDKVTEISKGVWNSDEYNGWISEILLNRFEVYDDDAVAYLDSACQKAMAAFETLNS